MIKDKKGILIFDFNQQEKVIKIKIKFVRIIITNLDNYAIFPLINRYKLKVWDNFNIIKQQF